MLGDSLEFTHFLLREVGVRNDDLGTLDLADLYESHAAELA